jgi:hypothetical protein
LLFQLAADRFGFHGGHHGQLAIVLADSQIIEIRCSSARMKREARPRWTEWPFLTPDTQLSQRQPGSRQMIDDQQTIKYWQ